MSISELMGEDLVAKSWLLKAHLSKSNRWIHGRGLQQQTVIQSAHLADKKQFQRAVAHRPEGLAAASDCQGYVLVFGEFIEDGLRSFC